MLRKLLVGYDGSEQASKALEYAVEILAQDDEAEIHLAYVIQEPRGVPDPVPDEVLETMRRTAEETLLNAQRQIRRSFSRPVVHLETGEPGPKLLELADKLNPDMVILGSPRHATAERLLGNTSAGFIRARRHPLLIVP